MVQGILIFLLSIAAAIFYGILHDQVTARICLEYFSIAHPPILGGTHDPTLLAFGWGIIATWWVGAILGIPLALAARVGKMPKRSSASMIRPIAVLMVCMALCALLAGIAGYSAGDRIRAAEEYAIPPAHAAGFMADAYAHLASYASGFLGGLILIAWNLFARWRADVRHKSADLRTAG